MAGPSQVLYGDEETAAEEEDEQDARMLQQNALVEPACELCGQRGSQPLQGPLSGPFVEGPLRLPPEDADRERTLLRTGGWAHTWCVHYATAERPPGSLAGDAPGLRGQERDTVRVVNAIRKGRRATCGVCWQPGATVPCGVAGCEQKFHLSCARWQPLAQADGATGPLSLGAVRCSRHLEDVQHFEQWRKDLEAFVLAEHPAVAATEEPSAGAAAEAAEQPAATLKPTHAVDETKQTTAELAEAAASAGSLGGSGAMEIDAPEAADDYSKSLSEAERRCEAVVNAAASGGGQEVDGAGAQGGAAAAATAARELLRQARTQQANLLGNHAVGDANQGQLLPPQPAQGRLRPLVRGAISIVCRDHLLLEPTASTPNAAATPEDTTGMDSAGTPPTEPQGELPVAVEKGATKLVRVAESFGAWQAGSEPLAEAEAVPDPAGEAGASASAAGGVGVMVDRFAAAAREALSLSKEAVHQATAKSEAIVAQKRELASISDKLQVEAEAEAKAREAVAQLERQLAEARKSLQNQATFTASLQKIADAIETKVAGQEAQRDESVAEANRALEGARSDLALVTALQSFVGVVGEPLLARRQTELQEHLFETRAQLRSLNEEVRRLFCVRLRISPPPSVYQRLTSGLLSHVSDLTWCCLLGNDRRWRTVSKPRPSASLAAGSSAAWRGTSSSREPSASNLLRCLRVTRLGLSAR
jgi:hypothetical protein